MADKYLNQTGLTIIRDWANGKFATTTVTTNISSSVAAIATAIPSSVSQLINNGDGTTNSQFATKNYVDQVVSSGGIIQKIKVNNTEQTVDQSDHSVNILVPTSVSQLINNSSYQTESDVQTAIGNAISSAYKYKGTVATTAALPSSNVSIGDVYDVQQSGMNYAWNGSAWDALGQYINTSLFWQKTELVAMTVAEVQTILNT